MNQKIKQLADQARNNVPAGLGVDQWIETYNQLFAELIVQECCAIADEVERADMDSFASKFIKAHFGVEDRAVPILSADEQALFAGITSSKLFTIAGAKKHFGVKE